MNIFDNIHAPIQKIKIHGASQTFIKREDLNHPDIMGNKLRKLKYNIIKAQELKSDSLLSFGGAYSNHILALSAAGKLFNIKTIGVIRGEELKNKELNPILKKAKDNGMSFHFVSREEYKNKMDNDFINRLYNDFGNFYLIPEGGSNDLAIRGAEEIIDDIKHDEFNIITCACGTGGTIAGIIKGLYKHKMFNVKVIGFPALKGGKFIEDEIRKFLAEEIYSKINWEINCGYHFGGYGKTKAELIDFIKEFKNLNNIDLDYIYTGKMMYGVFDLIKNNKLNKDDKILTIHTGGRQTALVKY